MYVLALDAAYQVYAVGCRLYAALMKASASNWYWPKAIINEMGFDYDNMSGNIAQLRAYINSFSQRLAAFNVPSHFPLYSRHL